jgi:hypothetical protein
MVAGVSPRHTLCRHAPEWWPDMARNGGPACSGISGRHRPESARDDAGRTHSTSAAHYGRVIDVDYCPLGRRRPSVNVCFALGLSGGAAFVLDSALRRRDWASTRTT